MQEDNQVQSDLVVTGLNCDLTIELQGTHYKVALSL